MHKYFFGDDGEKFVRPFFQFHESQWNFLRVAMDQVKRIIGDDTVTDSKALEFVVADFIATYGIEGRVDENLLFDDESQRKARDASRKFRTDEIRIEVLNSTDGRTSYRVFNLLKATSYMVMRLTDGWLCSCKDHKYRDVMCKHVRACEELENKLNDND